MEHGVKLMVLEDDLARSRRGGGHFCGLPRCASALEAEMAACMEGVSLVLPRNPASIVLETYCAVGASLIRDY